MANQVDPTSIAVNIPAAPPAAPSALADLLQFEAEIRRQNSVNELCYLMANDARRIIEFDQLFILKPAITGNKWQVSTASSIAMIDRNAPLIQTIEAAVSALGDIGSSTNIDTAQIADDLTLQEYPFRHWHWQPLKDKSGQPFAGFLLANENPLPKSNLARADRLAETTAHAWLALTNGKPVRRFAAFTAKRKRWLALGLLALALFPVRLTVLAPVEVVASRPYVLSAPFAGVIARINASPNQAVKAGDPVVAFEDIKLRNEMQQAIERLQVAKAKIERSTSAAFADADQARDIATTRAEYQLAQSDYNYARDLMAKSQIISPVAGMAIYSDRRDWEGRAVNVGDPIMQIADPKDVSLRIDMPAKEQMTLKLGGDVKIWLDADPLWSLSGEIEQASYQARPTAEGVLAFAITAKPVGQIPRIGSRGTAKLYGRWVPLIYSVLKRPIGSVRQMLGV
jgi:hypothetical protein